MANTTYRQRAKVQPPHISLGAARAMAGLTLDTVCERFEEATGNRLTRGALSGIENGHRGASKAVIEGLEMACGLRTGDIDTQYEPRNSKTVTAA